MRFFHDSILLRKDRPKILQEIRILLRKIILLIDKQQLAMGNKQIDPSLEICWLANCILLLPIFLKNFSLPCTPFETLS